MLVRDSFDPSTSSLSDRQFHWPDVGGLLKSPRGVRHGDGRKPCSTAGPLSAEHSAGTLVVPAGLSGTMTKTKTSDRVLAAFEGCYEAERAAALSGVPISTVSGIPTRFFLSPT
jgi:hypothetical protein